MVVEDCRHDQKSLEPGIVGLLLGEYSVSHDVEEAQE